MSHPGPASPPNPPPRRVLLVDDNAEGRRALARLLELYGYDVTSVADGTTAQELLRDRPPPDVLLTDMLLPDLDGRELALIAHRLVPRPLVVLITGWDVQSEPIELEPWGIDLLFPKPLDLAHLIRTLNETLSASGPTAG